MTSLTAPTASPSMSRALKALLRGIQEAAAFTFTYQTL